MGLKMNNGLRRIYFKDMFQQNTAWPTRYWGDDPFFGPTVGAVILPQNPWTYGFTGHRLRLSGADPQHLIDSIHGVATLTQPNPDRMSSTFQPYQDLWFGESTTRYEDVIYDCSFVPLIAGLENDDTNSTGFVYWFEDQPYTTSTFPGPLGTEYIRKGFYVRYNPDPTFPVGAPGIPQFEAGFFVVVYTSNGVGSATAVYYFDPAWPLVPAYADGPPMAAQAMPDALEAGDEIFVRIHYNPDETRYAGRENGNTAGIHSINWAFSRDELVGKFPYHFSYTTPWLPGDEVTPLWTATSLGYFLEADPGGQYGPHMDCGPTTYTRGWEKYSITGEIKQHLHPLIGTQDTLQFEFARPTAGRYSPSTAAQDTTGFQRGDRVEFWGSWERRTYNSVSGFTDQTFATTLIFDGEIQTVQDGHGGTSRSRASATSYDFQAARDYTAITTTPASTTAQERQNLFGHQQAAIYLTQPITYQGTNLATGVAQTTTITYDGKSLRDVLDATCKLDNSYYVWTPEGYLVNHDQPMPTGLIMDFTYKTIFWKLRGWKFIVDKRDITNTFTTYNGSVRGYNVHVAHPPPATAPYTPAPFVGVVPGSITLYGPQDDYAVELGDPQAAGIDSTAWSQNVVDAWNEARWILEVTMKNEGFNLRPGHGVYINLPEAELIDDPIGTRVYGVIIERVYSKGNMTLRIAEYPEDVGESKVGNFVRDFRDRDDVENKVRSTLRDAYSNQL